MSGFDEAVRKAQAADQAGRSALQSAEDRRRNAADQAADEFKQILAEFVGYLQSRGVEPKEYFLKTERYAKGRKLWRPKQHYSPAGFCLGEGHTHDAVHKHSFNTTLARLCLVTPDLRYFQMDTSMANGWTADFIPITGANLLDWRIWSIRIDEDGSPYKENGDRKESLRDAVAAAAARLIGS